MSSKVARCSGGKLKDDRIPASAASGAIKRKEPEVVVFTDPAKRKKLSQSNEFRVLASQQDEKKRVFPPSALKQADGRKEVLNMKTVRHEVYKFGVTGLTDSSKEDARVSLAIRLGAKPPKNKYVNYKILQEEKQKDRQRERLTEELMSFLPKGSKSKKKGVTSEKKRSGGDFGQIGRYKNGVQTLTQADIAKVTGKKRP